MTEYQAPWRGRRIITLASSALLSLALLLCNPSLAQNLPRQASVPGGIALVVLPELEAGSQVPQAYYRQQRVMVIRNTKQENKWLAVVGIPLDTQPGTQQLVVLDHTGNKYSIDFPVQSKNYREQRLTITNKRQVNPLKRDLDRILKEKKQMNSAFKEWHTTSPIFPEFKTPLKGPISSPFGLRRFFNEQPRKPHSGLDIAAPEGTPVYAPSGGTVSLTGNFFFNGNTLLINHSNGLVSMYCHLQTIDVEPGQRVEAGSLIGRVGKTGRVTGPHLHWSVSLNNARVDPGLLIDSLPKDG